jgi:Ca2+-binding EF-hand superfamily protein
MDDQWVEVQRGRIREAFALFDKDRKGELADTQCLLTAAKAV